MSAADEPPPASQSVVNAVLGTVIVGWQTQLILWGFAVAKLQHYLHTRAFRADPKWLKSLLMTAALACTAQAGQEIYSISFYSIWHYSTWQQRDEATLFAQTIPDCFATAPVGVVGALVQGYLIYRASILLRNQWLRAAYLVFMWCCVAVAFSGSMMYVAVSFIFRAGKPFPPGLSFGVAVGTWLWASAFVDLMITISLAVVLRSRIMHFNASTDSLLRRLIRLAVQTASYTAVLAICGAALAFSFSSGSPDSLYTNAAGSFYQPLSSCYLISLIVTLSFRNEIPQDHERNSRVPVISTTQLRGFASTRSIITNPSLIEPTRQQQFRQVDDIDVGAVYAKSGNESVEDVKEKSDIGQTSHVERTNASRQTLSRTSKAHDRKLFTNKGSRGSPDADDIV
ncbi:hypothetical protein OIV83_001336 [Microbotryomycetes sp. JL201]|nr:hypothetical protein OIV83_001336 [Microbotryomycetes sp. JL201]